MARKENKEVRAVKYPNKYLGEKNPDRKELSITPTVRYKARVEISKMAVQEATKLSRQISYDTLKNVTELMKYF